LGCLGDDVAAILSKRLNMNVIVRDDTVMEWLKEVANSYQLRMLKESPRYYLNKTDKGITFKEFLEAKLKEETSSERSIILGLGSQCIFADDDEVLKIRITASKETRIKRIASIYGMPEKEAENMLTKSDRKHKKYINTLYGKDWSDPLLYHATLSTDFLDAEACADIIESMINSGSRINKEKRGLEEVSEKTLGKMPKRDKKPEFKHPAEEEFARILDMYNIEWEYEPHTFPLKWDAEGNVTMAFSPDFYLVKFDTYLELTTMEQKYVTTKNKKVRMMNELYPDINVKIVYKKDFNSLVKRFSMLSGDDNK